MEKEKEEEKGNANQHKFKNGKKGFKCQDLFSSTKAKKALATELKILDAISKLNNQSLLSVETRVLEGTFRGYVSKCGIPLERSKITSVKPLIKFLPLYLRNQTKPNQTNPYKNKKQKQKTKNKNENKKNG